MSGVTRLFLIRHGDTADEETKKIYKGALDIPLSEKGRSRMKMASAFLSRFHLDHIYSSALSRCTESGSIISRPHSISLRALTGLNEISFGAWEGLSFEEIAKAYTDHFRLWLADPETHSPPGGETLRDAEKRINLAIDGILAEHRSQTIAVVAHGGVLRLVLCSKLGLKFSHLFRLAQDYGGISILDVYEDGSTVVKLINFTYYM
ncbi:MAG: histidine phosphatase family protein [Syntrophobacterales bacterium]|nr:histidine phosphatase family protein [Syntrophobacterales bacterium]